MGYKKFKEKEEGKEESKQWFTSNTTNFLLYK